jgi:hypothetical protein
VYYDSDSWREGCPSECACRSEPVNFPNCLLAWLTSLLPFSPSQLIAQPFHFYLNQFRPPFDFRMRPCAAAELNLQLNHLPTDLLIDGASDRWSTPTEAFWLPTLIDCYDVQVPPATCSASAPARNPSLLVCQDFLLVGSPPYVIGQGGGQPAEPDVSQDIMTTVLKVSNVITIYLPGNN